MCDRYSFFGTVDMLNDSFGIESMDSEPIENFNISPSQFVPVVLSDEDRIQLKHFHWGLIPSWANDATIGGLMINARDDSLPVMPCFKHPFRCQRCLIPANGYFDWSSEKGRKQPFFITGKNDKLLGFAGLWEQWMDAAGENKIESFTIITTDAIPAVAHLSGRMPVILTKEAHQAWLDPDYQDCEGLTKILKTETNGNLKFHEVSNDVNSPMNNSPELVHPMTETSTR